jgi:hypothetical protein
MARGHEQASLFVEKCQEAAPTSPEILRGLLNTITEYGPEIYDRVKQAGPVEKMYDRATDEDFLQKVDGIGEHYAGKIAGKVRSLERAEMRLYAILKQYGIPYSRGNKRERWTRAYFKHHPERLPKLEKNPYLLLHVADLWRQSVKEVSEKEGLAPVQYRLEDIDQPVVEEEPRFEIHTARLSAHMADILGSVYDEGHTVSSVEDALKAIKARGFDRVRPSLSAPERPINRDTLLRVARESPRLEIVSYRTPKGFLRKGITTPRLRSHASRVKRAVLGFRQEEAPFSGRMRSKMIRAAKESAGFDLTEEQQTALRNGFSSPISAVSGPAGSGKTTATTCFLRGALLALEKRSHHHISGGWTRQTGHSIYVTAPTGTAVQRIRRGLNLVHPETGDRIDPKPVGNIDAEATRFLDRGEIGIGTLHSFLGFRGPGRGFDVPDPHPSIIFVDEMSMSDGPTAAALCQYANRCMSYGAPVSILLAGDANQLPPVGRGFPFRDLLGGRLASLIPTTRLSKVMRQTGRSRIVRAANRVLSGKVPPRLSGYENPGEEDFSWVSPPSGPKINPMISRYESVLQRLGHDAKAEDIQVILPLRNPSSVEPGALHMRQVNQKLQRRFAKARGEPIQEMIARNPERPASKREVSFSLGDRVMHVGENEYSPGAHEPIMRGAAGKIVSTGENAIKVRYPWVNQPVLYDGPEEVWQLGLAYCLTCHAAQGSEFDYELLSIPRRAGPGMIDQSWLYTAITRAKKDLRMVAPRGRVSKAVQRNQGLRRQTLLASMEG